MELPKYFYFRLHPAEKGTAVEIEDASDADVVEIIRCKDCIWYDAYLDGIEKYQWDGFCSDWARKTYEDWYCSRAERRADERPY